MAHSKVFPHRPGRCRETVAPVVAEDLHDKQPKLGLVSWMGLAEDEKYMVCWDIWHYNWMMELRLFLPDWKPT